MKYLLEFVKINNHFNISSRARLVAEQWFPQAKSVRGVGHRQQKYTQNRASKEHLHAEIRRGVYCASDTQLDTSVSLL